MFYSPLFQLSFSLNVIQMLTMLVIISLWLLKYITILASASVWDAIVQTSHAHLLLATLQFLIESFIFRLKFLLHTVLLLNAIAITL